MGKITRLDFRKAAPEAAKPAPVDDMLEARFAAVRRAAELRQVMREASEAMHLVKTGGSVAHLSAPIQEFAKNFRELSPAKNSIYLRWNDEGWELVARKPKSQRPLTLLECFAAILAA